jgi:nitrogen fixation NifU-like protein
MIDELYQEVILDHNKRPRNFRALPDATHTAEGYNPLCGDRLTLFLKLAGDRVEGIGFQGSGCAISRASASVMTDTVKGKTRAEVEGLFQRFHGLVTGEPADLDALGELAALSGVSQFPMRVKCATLAWHTMRAAFEQRKDSVSTE